MTQCRTENALFSSEHVIQIRESTIRVRVCESRAHPVFNQWSGGSFPSYAISVAFSRWNFLLHVAKKNNNPAKFFCVFEAKWLGRLQWRTIHFFSFKKRPNISLYVGYSRNLLWFFEDFKSAYKATKFYAKWLVRITLLRTKTCTNFTSQKICCVKSRFQILYAVEQFSLLSSKDKFYSKGHTYTKPMIRLPRACRGRTAVRFPANSSHMCCVELALIGLASAGKGFPRSLTDGYAMLMSPSKTKQLLMASAPTCVVWSWRLIDCFALDAGFPRSLTERLCYAVGMGPHKGETVVLGFHCPSVGWSIGAACLDLHYFQCNRIKFNLFFINYRISWGF